jgi:fatty acid amide hydrolase
MWEKDPSVPPIPFDEKAYKDSSPLRIGYFKSDDWFEPCAAAQRGMDETIQGLVAAGHTCVPFQPPEDGKFRQGL